MIKLYRIDANSITDEDIRLVGERFPNRFARAQRLVVDDDRLSVIAAGVLLYSVLGVRDESSVRFTREGKPYIFGAPRFSISHSRGRCVLAVGEAPIGVDIEKLDESDLIAAEAALTEEELEWIKSSPLERFHVLWTRKESIFKAVGGFADPKDIMALDWRLPQGLSVKSSIVDGFALSVCSASSDEIADLDLMSIIDRR